jgi:iron uptake system component EfeO
MKGIAATVAVAMMLTACTRAEPMSTTAVDLFDSSIEASATHLLAGDIRIEIVNRGEFTHTLVITTSDGGVVTATDLLAPGDGTSIDVALAAGDYQFTCRIVSQTSDGRIIDHYQNGMVRAVTVAA